MTSNIYCPLSFFVHLKSRPWQCNPCYAIIIDSLTEFEEALTTFGTDYFFVLDVVGTAKFEAGRRGLAANAGGNKNVSTGV